MLTGSPQKRHPGVSEESPRLLLRSRLKVGPTEVQVVTEVIGYWILLVPESTSMMSGSSDGGGTNQAEIGGSTGTIPVGSRSPTPRSCACQLCKPLPRVGT